MAHHKDKIFCLMGPTAASKTHLAIELTKRLPFTIISVDSGMVYRGMDIGTAKPRAAELLIAPHHLIDICDPKEPYSVGQFRSDALQKITEIFASERIPLLVGGTMLYFRILQQGISHLPQANEQVRAKIKSQKDQLGLKDLYLQLRKIDPKTAANIRPTDSQRIQRALEVYELTGKSLSELQSISPPDLLQYNVKNIIVAPAHMAVIRSKIAARFQEMLDLGFIDEVQQLYNRGDLSLDLPAMRMVGYRQIWQYLSGQIGYEEMLQLVPMVTGQLAKRQLTWLKRWDDAVWFNSDDPNLLDNVMNLLSF